MVKSLNAGAAAHTVLTELDGQKFFSRVMALIKVHSGKVAETPVLKSVPSQFSPFILYPRNFMLKSFDSNSSDIYNYLKRSFISFSFDTVLLLIYKETSDLHVLGRNQ